MLTAEIRDAERRARRDADPARHLLATSPVRAELRARRARCWSPTASPGRCIALRLTDRDGRPVHHGLAGDFEVPAPYYPAVEADAQQARQLAGLERARPGLARRGRGRHRLCRARADHRFGHRHPALQLPRRRAASASSGSRPGSIPGERPWTIVGLAEGTIGFNRLDRNMEALGEERRRASSPTAGSRSTPGAGSAAAG